MNSKKRMVRLGRKVVIYYIVITLVMEMLSSLPEILDEFIGTFMLPFLLNDDFFAVPLVFIMSLMEYELIIYILCGLIFFLLTRKLIQKESEYQINQNSMIYAAAAHDLKTLITSTQGFSKALYEGKIPEDEKEEIYDIIYRKGKSMDDIVNVMAEYASLGTNEYKLKCTEIDICSLVRDIIADQYCSLEEHDIELDLDIPETPVIIPADKPNISRAFTNLIVNSYKHNPDGIKLFVQIKKEKTKCIISIADNGTEIPKGMEIFEPFVTENESRTPGKGTGLGLSITKRIIEKHNGKIELVNHPEGYTKAFVTTLNCITKEKTKS